MKTKRGRSSWVAFGLFYIVLVLIVSLLDAVNNVFKLSYWGAQIGLITVGIGVFALVGTRLPDQRGLGSSSSVISRLLGPRTLPTTG